MWEFTVIAPELPYPEDEAALRRWLAADFGRVWWRMAGLQRLCPCDGQHIEEQLEIMRNLDYETLDDLLWGDYVW